MPFKKGGFIKFQRSCEKSLECGEKESISKGENKKWYSEYASSSENRE